MSRRRKQEHGNHERWLVSYADFITLLFAFFVVLYSASQVDQKKAQQISQAIHVAFQQLGMFPAGQSAGRAVEPPGPRNSHTQQFDGYSPLKLESMVQPFPAARARAIRRELEETLRKELAKDEVSVNATPEGVVLSLREVGFFDSGSAIVRADARPTLSRIAKVLAEYPNRIRIEGHTDNVPVHTPRYATNWELSTARATELVKRFIEEYGFSPQRLSAAGYAEFHPAGSNATPQGRSQNRRVDLVVIEPAPVDSRGRDTPVPPKPLVDAGR